MLFVYGLLWKMMWSTCYDGNDINDVAMVNSPTVKFC